MDDIASIIPKSVISIIGLAAIIFLLKIVWTFAEEWGKQFYRMVRGNNGKEKRHEMNPSYNGYERRSEEKGLESAMAELVHALAEERREMTEFISSWKEYKTKVVDDIDDIKRKQDKNWKRLFDEELPSMRHS